MSKSESSPRESLDLPEDYHVDVESPTTKYSEDSRTLDVNSSSPPPSYEYVLEEVRSVYQFKPVVDNLPLLQTKLQSQREDTTPTESTKGPEIFHKSSKELYKAVAKQFGITCKMSDQCRCLDCQSHYFDCEYDQNEDEKTDGGLGAGTPMFISEVMHGTACTIL